MERSLESEKFTVIFVGAGHANCIAMKALKAKLEKIKKDVRVIVISDMKHSWYSGMLPVKTLINGFVVC